MTSSSTINTTQILNLIHKAEAKLKDANNPDLRMATETALSILVFNLRKPYASVSFKQAEAIERFKNLLGETV
jgi:hypothetical protein